MRQSESGPCNAHDLPFHPFLRHPHTRQPLQAVGRVRDRLIWPMLGAAEGDSTGSGDGKPDDGKGDKTDGADDGKPDDGKGDKTDDGQDWQAKFEGQREVSRRQQADLNRMKDGLKAALGIEDKNSKPDELVAGLNRRLDEMQHNILVSDVARRHGITDDDDIDFLRTAKDEDAMKKLAERLKPTGDSKDDDSARGRGRGPKPDKSQSSSSVDGSGTRPTSVEAVREERRRNRDAAGKK